MHKNTFKKTGLNCKTLLNAILKTCLFGWIIWGVNFCSANQLINDLPINLSKNWLICSHYNLEETLCLSNDLPLEKIPLKAQLNFQTFEKKLIISSALKDTPLGLWLQNIDEVDEVYLNKQLIGKTGLFFTRLYYRFSYSTILLNT